MRVATQQRAQAGEQKVQVIDDRALRFAFRRAELALLLLC